MYYGTILIQMWHWSIMIYPNPCPWLLNFRSIMVMAYLTIINEIFSILLISPKYCWFRPVLVPLEKQFPFPNPDFHSSEKFYFRFFSKSCGSAQLLFTGLLAGSQFVEYRMAQRRADRQGHVPGGQGRRRVRHREQTSGVRHARSLIRDECDRKPEGIRWR